MKTFKEFLEEEFALPKYPNQTDKKSGDWVTGDPAKSFSYDTSKDGYENMKVMNDLVDKDREKMK